MDFGIAPILDEFLSLQQDVFTVDDAYKFFKKKGIKITKNDIYGILDNSDFVFALVNDEFVTRAGVFLGRWFSFKPSKEEIQKGSIILGHRCMPFVDPQISPDHITVISDSKVVKPKATTFSMNLALDVFALFGEGYVLPYVFNDHSNTKVPLASVQYGMPSEIDLTSWPLNKIEGGRNIKYGDRILCRLVSWEDCSIEVMVQKVNSSTEITAADLEREEWYTDFENGLLDSFEKNGPTNSIEEQLAFLFLENQSKLCIQNCGSAEEFLKHTRKIGFAPYGVESRIWRVGESVPFVGSWNEKFSTDSIFMNMSVIFTPQIVDAYLKDYIYYSKKSKKDAETKLSKEDKAEKMEALLKRILPDSLKMTSTEHKFVLLNIEKRHDILLKTYNLYRDYKLAPVRKRIMDLFSQVNSLMCAIGCSGLKMADFPQQELVILVQLSGHIVRIIEEMENEFIRDSFPVDEVLLSLSGMEETFEEISSTLRISLDVNTYKNIQILS